MDHGGGNLSTFTGKAASGKATVYRYRRSDECFIWATSWQSKSILPEFVLRIGTSDEQVESFVRGEFAAGSQYSALAMLY